MTTAAAAQKAENNLHLTPGQYKGLALVCVLLGVWASWITWRFFVHGSQAMEADPSVLEISIAAATMFIVCEMGAFALAKMLPAERLYALRWQLLAFAGAMLVFECVTIILTQRGITMAADIHAKAVDSRASPRFATAGGGAASPAAGRKQHAPDAWPIQRLGAGVRPPRRLGELDYLALLCPRLAGDGG